MGSEFVELECYRGFILGKKSLSGIDSFSEGFIKAGQYGVPLRARYGETVHGLKNIVDDIYLKVKEEIDREVKDNLCQTGRQ